MRSRLYGIITHVVVCFGFILLPYSFGRMGTNFPSINLSSSLDLSVLISYLLILSFLYLNYYVLIPRFYFTNRYIIYWSLVIATCLIVVNIPTLLLNANHAGRPPQREFNDAFRPHRPPGNRGEHRPDPGPPLGGPPPYTHGIFISAIGVFLTLYIRVNNQWKVNERKKLSAELSSLKFQINPHFLFNTLNSIYALSIREKGRATADSILKLSGIMRYVVTEAGKDLVPLRDEVNYINDYVALQKIRLGPSVQFHYEINGDTGDLKISPLILITFIENAFKYGVNPDESSDVVIQIDIHAGTLALKVRNKKVKLGSSEPLSSGVGIENTRARLDFYYSGHYNLNINDDGAYYEVRLTIALADTV
jgi:hypothetical protein